MLGQILRRFPLIPRDADKLNRKFDKPEEQFNLCSSSGVTLGRVEFIAHLLK